MIRQQGFVSQVFVKLDEFQSLICICIFFFYLYLKLFHVSPRDETDHRARYSLLNYNHCSHGEIVIFHKGNSVA